MSKFKYIIKLNNISFEFISKCYYNDRDYIKVKSIKEHEAKVFYVYSSKILFGLYKIHYDDEDEYLETIESFENITSNLLCFELQRYIFENIQSIPVDINISNEVKRYKNSKLTRNIFDGNRLQGFLNHEDIMQENIYLDQDSLLDVCKFLGIKNIILENIIESSNEIDLKDSDKIELLKDVKNKLVNELSSFNYNNDNILFNYKKEYYNEKQPYLKLDVQIKQRQIIILNKKYNVFYLNYNSDNILLNKKFTDLKYIICIVDVNATIDEYGLYSLYYDNMYNKLSHFIYDDETFFNNDLLDLIRIHSDENLIFVGNLSNFSFK